VIVANISYKKSEMLMLSVVSSAYAVSGCLAGLTTEKILNFLDAGYKGVVILTSARIKIVDRTN